MLKNLRATLRVLLMALFMALAVVGMGIGGVAPFEQIRRRQDKEMAKTEQVDQLKEIKTNPD